MLMIGGLNRSFLNSKNPHFQNEANCRPFLQNEFCLMRSALRFCAGVT